jgi:hypothetical protein
MPKQQWTTKEEHEWLSTRLTAFVEAQEQKSLKMTQFFSPIYTKWFEMFPACEPTDEKVAKADSNREVAAATIVKKTKTVGGNFLKISSNI